MTSSYSGSMISRDTMSVSGHLDLLSKAIEDEESSPTRITSSPTANAAQIIESGKSPHGTKAKRKPVLGKKLSLPTSPSSKDESETGEFCSPQHHQMVAMPPDFIPGPFDVLCGRGRACKTAAGNLAYRDSILLSLAQYGAAESKLAKGSIISDIMQSVREKCHSFHQNDAAGGFIKCVNGVWYEVGDFLAREKTSQCFRDALASNYSSSAQSKYLRRRAKEAENGSDHQTSAYTVRKSLDEALAQLPFKKRKRRLSEDAAVDVLHQMATSSHRPTLPVEVLSTSSPHTPSVSSMATSSLATDCTTHTSPVMAASPFDAMPQLPSIGERTGTLVSQPALSPTAMTLSAPPSPSFSASENEVRVCALQPELRPPSQSPWDALVRVQRLMESIMANEAVDLFVLPELSPVGYSEDTFARFLPLTPSNQAMYQEFDRFFQIAARNLNVYICYGTIGWSFERRLDASSHHGIPKMFIRQIVVDRLGTQVACYDKSYLRHDGARAETRFFTPGPASHPSSFVVHCTNRSSSFRFGLLICSDVRFPNLARRLAGETDHRVDCILQPSSLMTRNSWFRTSASFQETRAMENSIYWIAVNYAGDEFGESAIVPPFVDEGNEPIKLGNEEGYVVGRVSRSVLDHVRRSFPFYHNLLSESSSHKEWKMP